MKFYNLRIEHPIHLNCVQRDLWIQSFVTIEIIDIFRTYTKSYFKST